MEEFLLQKRKIYKVSEITGEIRAVSHVESRIKEASKMGFTQCIVPKNAIKQITKVKDIKILGVSFLKEVMEILF